MRYVKVLLGAIALLFSCCFQLRAQRAYPDSFKDNIVHLLPKTDTRINKLHDSLLLSDSLYSAYLEGHFECLSQLTDTEDCTIRIISLAIKCLAEGKEMPYDKYFASQLFDYMQDTCVDINERRRCADALSKINLIVKKDRLNISQGKQTLLYNTFVPYIIQGGSIVMFQSPNMSFNLLQNNSFSFMIEHRLFGSLYQDVEILEKVKESLLNEIFVFGTKNVFNNIGASLRYHFNPTASNNFDTKWMKYGTAIDYILHAVISNSTQQSIISAYQAALMKKNLLLQKEINIKKYVYESQDTTLIELYEDIIKSERDATQDNTFLRTLSQKAKNESFPYASWLITEWTDIRTHLTENDLAVEFVRSTYNADTCYYALTLRKHDDVPKFHYLCTEFALKQYSRNTISHTGLYDLLWKPLHEEIEQAHNVYFSSDGLLHIIPMEFILQQSNKNPNLCIYRLSSTRELCRQVHITAPDSITIYGGITYDIDEDEYDQAEYIGLNTHTMREAYQNTFEYLPGTLHEAMAIDSICKHSGISSTLLTHQNATKSSFFNLSNRNNDIIHVATHGFWFDDADILSNSMFRSGLMMSQAPLFSAEISKLNLNSTTLVTLSACDTGLGDITGDGVFGLQRGFKKAGANSILMSLWKVDDEATCKLMTEFYSNWIAKKMTKHDALEAAKKTVRETKGWEDPKYWAAFILLDGLD